MRGQEKGNKMAGNVLYDANGHAWRYGADGRLRLVDDDSAGGGEYFETLEEAVSWLGENGYMDSDKTTE